MSSYADYDFLMYTTELLLGGIVEQLEIQPSHGDKSLDFSSPFSRIEFLLILESATGLSFPSPYDELDSQDLLKFLLSVCEKQGVEVGSVITVPRLLDKLMGRLVEPKLVQPAFLLHHPW